MKWLDNIIPWLILLVFPVSLLVVLFSYWGLVDIDPVTTQALLDDRRSYIGKVVTLRNVAITGVEFKKLNEKEIFLVILATNTHLSYSQPENPRDVISILARAPLKQSMESGLIPQRQFGLDIDRRRWFPFLEIKIEQQYNNLTTMPESMADYGSWLTTPYDLTMAFMAQFFSLQISVLVALVIQLIVSLIVCALVIMGAIIVLPGI